MEHITGKGKGAGVTVSWRHEFLNVPGAHLEEDQWYIALGHELIHAYHAIEGEWLPPNREDKRNRITSQGTVRSSREEWRTVGIKGYSCAKCTENGLRKDHGNKKMRTKYFDDD